MTEDNIDEESLRDLQSRTARLPREIAPPPDAWDAIAAEIHRTTRSTSQATGSRVERSHVWQRPAFLAAAALLLVAGSSAITAIALSPRSVASPPAVMASQNTALTDRPATRRSGGPATLADFTLVENDYISTANRLSEILESDETQLAPETIAKLKESLRVIDAAILEARQALAADPANKQLIEMLSTSYSQKVDLLKRTTEMGQS
ncbi:MAG TPA: hypothetical protein VHM24_13520 [Gemmatimonadaceae bacterium]|nr:hypothetical protein [Gemmatimonadaceae bacterium]